MYKAALLSMAFLIPSGCNAILDVNDPPAPEGDVAVSILSPAAGQEVKSLVEISASAVASGGEIASVQFDLPNGISVTDRTAPFSAMWDSTTVMDGAHMVGVTATDDQGLTGKIDAAITVHNAPCPGETSAATGLPRSIPDHPGSGNSTPITSAIQVSGSGAVAGASLSLNIRHVAPGDLNVELISPAGSRVRISTPASTPNFVITNQAITSFNGQAVAGAWTMHVEDAWPQDAGTLDSWSLTVTRDCKLPAL